MGETIDLQRVRRTYEELDRLVREHPDLTSQEAQERLSEAFPAVMEDETMANDEAVSLRLPAGTMDRAEALIVELKKHPALQAARVSRAFVLRLALLRGLEELEREAKGR
jgi:hypothetical protein